MAIIRVTDYVEAYRLRALSPNFHEMAGRDGKDSLTEFVNSQIARHMDFSDQDVLVDIGCGTGKLLDMAGEGLRGRIGVLPTKEEQSRLQTVLQSADIRVGLAQNLPVESGCASKIVCNAVLLYMASEDDVRSAFSEIARIARPGARVWLGEIPDSDDYVRFQQYRGTSVLGLLWHLLTTAGLRPFLGMIRRILKSLIGRDRIVLSSPGLYYATPDEFVRLAGDCGLKLEHYFRHQELDERGNIVESPSRYDYIFTV
jgi:SAM-dependent methyltransferase